MTASLLLLLGTLAAEPASQPAILSLPSGQWDKSELGETIIVPMESAPYPHPSRENGFKIEKRVYPRDPHYVDNSVGLFIPHGYRAGPKVDVLVYLHGHLNTVRKALDYYKLREQIVASGRNIILIFPEGPKDATDSGCGKLEDADGLRHLVEESLKTLHTAGKIENESIGRVMVAGHSGAYRGFSFCLERGGLDQQLTDVCLLDSSYANLDKFVDWVVKHPKGRFFSIFTDHLSPENVYLMTHIAKAGQTYTLLIAEDAKDAKDDVLAGTRVLFLHTVSLKHDQTVRWLERWLRSRTRD
jgi:hypothetical protein